MIKVWIYSNMTKLVCKFHYGQMYNKIVSISLKSSPFSGVFGGNRQICRSSLLQSATNNDNELEFIKSFVKRQMGETRLHKEESLAKSDIVYNANYGNVKFDSEHVPKSYISNDHQQSKSVPKKESAPDKESKLNNVGNGKTTKQNKKWSKLNSGDYKHSAHSDVTQHQEHVNYFDELIFSDQLKHTDKIYENRDLNATKGEDGCMSSDRIPPTELKNSTIDLNYFDQLLVSDTIKDNEAIGENEISLNATKSACVEVNDRDRGNRDLLSGLNYFDKELTENLNQETVTKHHEIGNKPFPSSEKQQTLEVVGPYKNSLSNEIEAKDEVKQIQKRLQPRSKKCDSSITENQYVKHKLIYEGQKTNLEVQSEEIKSQKYEQIYKFDEDEETVHDSVQKQQKNVKSSTSSAGFDNTSNETAYDYVKRMRREKASHATSDKSKESQDVKDSQWQGKFDSLGFRILTDQCVNLKYFTRDSLIHMLYKSVIYEDDEIVAINKPYGLASHGGPSVVNSIGQLLKPLAKKVNKKLDNLYIVHRPDKDSTGVMLLAKSSDSASKLNTLIKDRQIVKKYLAITKGVPSPAEGVIDIPMCETLIEGKVRMGLKPFYPKEMREDPNISKSRGISSAQQAITNFQVLDSYGTAALVECQPESGVKQQIRCHLAFALNTPILGDHKYSHLSKIAPQKLNPDILQRLRIRQAKVRHLSMHLHAHKIIIPEIKNGRNLYISAQLPKHFVQNLKWLKLSLNKK